MTTLNRGSAQIYQFPVGGRAGLERAKLASNTSSEQPLTNVSFGSGWYHDEAIEEAEARKH